MAEFSTKVKLYLEANSKTWDSESDNIVLRDDGSGAYIDTWNVSGLSKPTDSQIASYESYSFYKFHFFPFLVTTQEPNATYRSLLYYYIGSFYH